MALTDLAAEHVPVWLLIALGPGRPHLLDHAVYWGDGPEGVTACGLRVLPGARVPETAFDVTPDDPSICRVCTRVVATYREPGPVLHLFQETTWPLREPAPTALPPPYVIPPTWKP